jgi:hypothetical protein
MNTSPMPPGPAFIPWSPPPRWSYPTPPRWSYPIWYRDGDANGVTFRPFPAGYIWSPPTESTMAGWVRPKGGAL